MANTVGLRADCPACGTVEVAIDDAVLVPSRPKARALVRPIELISPHAHRVVGA
jgi:hypothetical protein